MHTFKNFKNFADAEIDLSKPMTLLIGRNGSGKSNVIEGVELLAELVKGRALNEITDIGRKGAFEIRGGLAGCLNKNEEIPDLPEPINSLKIEECFELGFNDPTFSGFLDNKKELLTYSISINTSELIQIINEQASFGEKKYLFLAENKKHNNILSVRQNFNADGIENITSKEKNFPANISIISNSIDNINSILSLEVKNTNLNDSFTLDTEELMATIKTFDILTKTKQYIESVFAFDIQPQLMRNYEPIGESTLTKNASNLSSVLYHLQQNSPDILEKILTQIQQLPEEPFTDFEFITTSANDVLFALKQGEGFSINAKLLSDGTLRTLAILTALETAPEGSRIIIEEIDNGVHASRTKLLIDAIWEASHRRKLNTLITTHNPATLDGLEDDQLKSVVICHYDKQSQSSKLTPFFELPQVDVLLQKGKLGGLVTQNIIERYLDPEFEKEQQKIALEWLESME